MLAASGRGSDSLDHDLPGFLLSERHVRAADAVLYGVAEGRELDHPDEGSLGEAHVEEPSPEGEQDPEQPTPRNRALILKAEPQDAVVLKYLLDVVGTVSLAKRSPENEALFNVQPVNINYLMLRYGVVLPQPLE